MDLTNLKIIQQQNNEIHIRKRDCDFMSQVSQLIDIKVNLYKSILSVIVISIRKKLLATVIIRHIY